MLHDVGLFVVLERCFLGGRCRRREQSIENASGLRAFVSYAMEKNRIESGRGWCSSFLLKSTEQPFTLQNSLLAYSMSPDW